jgi:hypothetical protein
VQPHKVGFWRWARINLFDGWQVLGTIGLVAGAFVFSVMLVQTKHLPSTGSAFQLVQTLVPDKPTPQPSPEPTPEASPAPTAANPGVAVVQRPSASRSGVYRKPAPTPVPTSAPTASALPIPVPTPTPRFCITKICPSPTPSPSPS